MAMRSSSSHRYADPAVPTAVNECAIFARRTCATYGRRLHRRPHRIHLTIPFAVPPNLRTEGASPAELDAIAALTRYGTDGGGYSQLQATRPQTIGYAFADSAVELAAWIYEKFQPWTDNSGDPKSALTRDDMLDDMTLYWFTNTATSSARLYRENATALGPMLAQNHHFTQYAPEKIPYAIKRYVKETNRL
jgi:hypothetical protein